MKRDFWQMTDKRLKKIRDRYAARLVNVVEWTPKRKNLYYKLVTVVRLLADRRHKNKSGGLRISEMVLNNITEQKKFKHYEVRPPWKKKNYLNNLNKWQKRNNYHQSLGHQRKC